MVIDDAPIDRLIVERVVLKNQFATEVLSFESVSEALEYLQRYHSDQDKLPGLIFLDINMPDMNGFDFLNHYHLMPESVKSYCAIVMLSSSLMPADLKRAEENPFVHRFITKPLHNGKLEDLRSTFRSK
jgi:CheY-like chemotaxis protein